MTASDNITAAQLRARADAQAADPRPMLPYREIPVGDDLVALVDLPEYEFLSQFNWFLNTSGYAVRNVLDRHPQAAMHRVILMAPPGIHCDHINGDKLDNRRFNLRLATPSQNGMNKDGPSGGHSRYKGVSRHGNKWRAYIVANRKQHYLGLFHSEVEAARAYDAAAIRIHGAFARLNFGGPAVGGVRT